MIAPPLSLVPPRRLGTLLASVRTDEGRSLDDVARSSPFGVDDLAAIEAGTRPLDDDAVAALLDAYRLEPDAVVPVRTELVVDLDDGRIASGASAREVAAPTADEVLTTYLSLVYTMRNATPGTPLVLRDADVDVLSRALDLAHPEVEHRLHDLMAEPQGAVRRRMGGLRARVLVPVAGMVVAATAIGTLLVVARSDDGDSTPAPATTDADTPVIVTSDEPARVGPASVQTPEGGLVVEGEDIPAAELPPDAANVGQAQTAVRNPDGSVSQFPTPDDTTATTPGP